MIIKTSKLLFFFFSVLPSGAFAQAWRIKNYSAGYKIFEVTSVGNNPYTITPLLKDPVAYQNYINTITVNNFNGNPQIMRLHTIYVNAEFQKDSALSRFWKKTTIQAGVLLTTRIRQGAGAIGDESFVSSPDTVLFRNMYSLTKNQQFFGANLGLNRRFAISKKLSFLTGLHAQGSFALVHYYQQQWDSTTFKPGVGRNNKTTNLPNIKGKNFFQWQVLVPLGLEYEFVKERFFIRMELAVGIIGSDYRPKYSSAKEAHGAGIWLVYQPKGRWKT
jgi:hypothetical protein